MLEDIIILKLFQLRLTFQHPILVDLNPCQVVFEILTEFIENFQSLCHLALLLRGVLPEDFELLIKCAVHLFFGFHLLPKFFMHSLFRRLVVCFESINPFSIYFLLS